MTSRFAGARQSGVTLIELMIVFILIGIVAAIAVPAYRSHVLRAQRSDATSALLRVQAAQEKFFVQNGRYSADLRGAPGAGGLGLSASSERGFYAIAVSLTPNGYTATASAIPANAQTEDRNCRSFTIKETGARSALDASGADRTAECWR